MSAKNDYFVQREKEENYAPSSLTPIAEYPKNALVELSNKCNHVCVFCKNSDQDRGFVDLHLDTYEKFIEQAVALGLKEVGLYSTGEPFITKNLVAYIATAKNLGVERVYLTTNGVLATLPRVKQAAAAGLDSIKFSINASNRSDYQLVHGFDDFEKVLKNVKEIWEWKNTDRIPLQMLGGCVRIASLPESTFEEHEAIFSQYFEHIMYADAVSQCGQAFNLSVDSELKQLVFHDFGVRSDDLKFCSNPWNKYYVTAEGYLTACCIDYELDLAYADLNTVTLREAWNNKVIMNLREQHLKGNVSGTICDQCLRNEKRPYHPLALFQKKEKSEPMRDKEKLKLKKRLINIKEVT